MAEGETLLWRLVEAVPSLRPPAHYPQIRPLEASLERGLREVLEEEGLDWSLARLGDGRYLAQAVGEGGRVEAVGFAGWKALAKAYLRWRGLS